MPNPTIQAAVTSSAVLTLKIARYLADVRLSAATRQRADVSRFLAELDAFTREVSLHGPNAAADAFTPQKGITP